MPTAALKVVNLHVQHAQIPVVDGISLYAMSGETVVLLGPDGSARRATLRAIIGQTETRQGSTQVIGTETIHNHNAESNSLELGMLRPDGGISSHLTCEENLLLPDTHGATLGGAMSLSQIYELCPDLDALRHTPGTRLSGAERRMLAIARMLRTGVSVLLMDDVSDGLAPVMTRAFSDMILNLKKHGYTIIMGARDLDFCAPLADRFYVMENGLITEMLGVNELAERRAHLNVLLGATTHNPSDSKRRDTH